MTVTGPTTCNAERDHRIALGCPLPPQYTLGRVAPGYAADLLILRPGADPLADVCVLAEAGGAAVAAVIKGGLLAKAPTPAAAAAEGEGGGWWALNDKLFGI